MRITVVSGERHVSIKTKGSSAKKLRRVEKAVARLLAATPEPPPSKPFGFSVAADTQIAYGDD